MDSRSRRVLGAAVLLMVICQVVASQESLCSSTRLECCRFLPYSKDFQECCEGGCCPDCDAVHYIAASDTFTTAQNNNCLASYECCVYPVFSREWMRCCSRHPCCTLCHSVSKGCCYNGRLYRWGSVVESFPESNTALVCGARVSIRETPHLTAAIVTHFQPLQDERRCQEPASGHCFRTNGIVYEDGAEWLESPGYSCRCRKGKPICMQLPTVNQCPDPFSFGILCVQSQDLCLSDKDCPQGLHCCEVGSCGRSCIMTDPKPGECLVINNIVPPICPPFLKDRCQIDQQCPGRQKCCFLECIKDCSDPLP